MNLQVLRYNTEERDSLMTMAHRIFEIKIIFSISVLAKAFHPLVLISSEYIVYAINLLNEK